MSAREPRGPDLSPDGLPPDELPPEELGDVVPEDDAVIGRAFRRSLAVLAVAALAVAAFVLTRGDEDPRGEAAEAEAVAPRAVEEDAAAPALPFTDVTRRAGVAFVHSNGARGEKLLPETMGGGVACFDLEDDGDVDLLFVDSGSLGAEPAADGDADGDAGFRAARPALYVNDGTGRFDDRAEALGLGPGAGYGMGAAVADADGDGDRDVFVTALGENTYWRNDGGRFVDATAEAGLAGRAEDWSTCAAFFDHDGDGDLDLYVGNYVRWSRAIDFAVDFRLVGLGRAYGPPTNFEGAQPYLYRNDGGTFVEVAADAGLHVTSDATGVPVGKALGCLPLDVDGDGRLDLVVANDTVRNFYYRNLGDGTFEERGSDAGLAFDRSGNSTGAMGIDAARYRNDDDLAIAIGNFANEMTSFFVAPGGSGRFTDQAIVDGLGRPTRVRLSFGLCFLDADLDGRQDLVQANGHLEDEIEKVQKSQTYAQPAQLFWNAGRDARATFVEVAPELLGDLARPLVGRGVACADLDGDGDLDVVLTQTGGPPRLLRNDQALGHHWLRVRLVGPPANRDAIGARVLLEAGGTRQELRAMPFKSYLSQSESTLTFGLGPAPTADRLTVHWPDGTTTELTDVPADQVLVVER